MIYSALAMWVGWWMVWLFAFPRPKVMQVTTEEFDKIAAVFPQFEVKVVATLEPKRESYLQRAWHWIPLMVGIVLIFATVYPACPFEQLHLPGYVKWVGLFATAFGLILASYSRLYLANNWSARVEIQHDHELVSDGPYSVVRHPIYNGLIGAFLGTAMVAGTGEALAGVLWIIVAFAIKAIHEEEMLAKEFPEGYSVLKRMVPYKIFPWIY